MGLKYFSKEFNNYINIPPLSSDVDLPLYANTSVSYNKKHQYSSQSSSSETSMIKNYTSIQNHDGITYHLEKNIYANIKRDIAINSPTLDENNNNRIYENVKLGPTSSLSYQKTSFKNVCPSSSSPIYINLKQDEDKPPVIPTPLPKNDQKEDVELSSIQLKEIKQVDIETNVLEKRSNTKTKQTVKKTEVNMVPNYNDKSDLYRTKIPSTITRILPTLRQRRTLHRSRRYRRRSSTPFRTIVFHSNTIRRQQQDHSNSNMSAHHSMSTNNQRKCPANKSVSNELYNEIQQQIVSDNQSINSYYTEEVFESPVQFHDALQHEILSCYPTENVSIPQVLSTSENGESVHQDEATNEEELCPHNTFEDFLLRRPSKSSCSTLASVTNTLISEEIPVRPPPLNRPLSSDITLNLDKKDVDFIHDIIHRTHGDQRVSNRITALREAYIHAANKRNDLLKTKKVPQNKKKITTKHALITSKIRDELEKYDELPVHRKPSFNDDEDDIDETYSANDGYRYRHRRLPPVPSTANRIINFVTTLKRQLQKNFQDIRSRILIESMSNSSRRRPIHHNSSGPSRRHRPRSHNISRNTNHEYSYPSHRHQFSRTYSDTSAQHLSHRPQTFRVTSHLQRQQRMN